MEKQTCVQTVAALKNLVWLHLIVSDLDIDLRPLAELKKLVHLIIDNATSRGTIDVDGLTGIEKLSELHLHGFRAGLDLTNCVGLARLKRLCLSGSSPLILPRELEHLDLERRA
jgi:hypothetical protein